MVQRFLHFMVCTLFVITVHAADWSTWCGDAQRSSVSTEQLTFPLQQAWHYTTNCPPSPGFVYQKTGGTNAYILENPTSYFDFAYAPIIVGEKVYFGTTTEQALFCLQAGSGETLWSYYTEGAIRLAPTIVDGKLYCGSDDGHVYCLHADTGALLWKYFTGESQRRIIANGKISSQWPIRTSVSVEAGRVYVASGLFPDSGGVNIFAIDAESGKLIWKKPSSFPFQGYILSAEDKIFVPVGRSAPIEYFTQTGEALLPYAGPYIKGRREGGGAYVGKVGKYVVYGPTEFGVLKIRTAAFTGDITTLSKREKSEAISRVMGSVIGIKGSKLMFSNEIYYLYTEQTIHAIPAAAFDRICEQATKDQKKGKKVRSYFKNQSSHNEDKKPRLAMIEQASVAFDVGAVRSLLIAGDVVVVGGEKRVAAYALASGTVLWEAAIEGTAWELAVAYGAIYVGTSTGGVYAFTVRGTDKRITAPEKKFSFTNMPAMEAAAEYIMQQATTHKGYCFVLGAGEGALAYALTQVSELTIVCIEPDEEKRKTLQDTCVAAGVYGSRIVAHANAYDALDYAHYIANLIVSEDTLSGGTLSYDAAEAYRILQPYGGALVIGSTQAEALQQWGAQLAGWQVEAGENGLHWGTLIRGDLEKGGEWTHIYANPQNTSASDDALLGQKFLIQWFGEPGPDILGDRHATPAGPLSKDGRLFVVGDDIIATVDAYNGTPLWRCQVPESARLGVLQDSGNACVNSSHFYIAAKDKAWCINPASGVVERKISVPTAGSEWGYIACTDTLLYGTSQSVEAAWRNLRAKNSGSKYSWKSDDKKKGIKRKISFGTQLFAYDVKSGKKRWDYSAVIMNTSITFGENSIYFLENRNPEVLSKVEGRVTAKVFTAQDAFIVALDSDTGEKQWEQPYTQRSQIVAFGLYAQDVLFFISTYYGEPEGVHKKGSLKGKPRQFVYYNVGAYHAKNGVSIWNGTVKGRDVTPTSAHSFDLQHPVIIGDHIYMTTVGQSGMRIFNIKTGTKESVKGIRGGKYCGQSTASATGIYYRKDSTQMFHISTQEETPLSTVTRPGCFINMLPVGGLLLMPEATAGCNCGFPLQTSFALFPAE